MDTTPDRQLLLVAGRDDISSDYYLREFSIEYPDDDLPILHEQDTLYVEEETLLSNILVGVPPAKYYLMHHDSGRIFSIPFEPCPPPTSPLTPSGSSDAVAIGVGVTLGILVLGAVVGIGLWLFIRKRRKFEKGETIEMESFARSSSRLLTEYSQLEKIKEIGKGTMTSQLMQKVLSGLYTWPNGEMQNVS